MISTASTFTATALATPPPRASLGKLVGKAGATVTSGQYFWLQVAGYAASVNGHVQRGEYRAGQHHHGRASRRRVGGQLGQGDRARARGNGGRPSATINGGGDPQLPAIGT